MYLGIDPGIKGAFAVINQSGGIERYWKMPLTADKKIHAVIVYQFLNRLFGEFPIAVVGIEQLLTLPSDTNKVYVALKDLEGYFFKPETIHINVVKGQFQYIYKELKKTDGRVGTKTMGVNWGIVYGQVCSFGVRTQVISPRTWQAVMHKGIENASKMMAKSRSEIAARQIWPKESFIPFGSRKPDDGIIDACLIGDYVRRMV